MEFKIASNIVSDNFDSVVYELDSNETTLEKYPFPFALQIEYKLKNEKLHCNYRVKNTGDSECISLLARIQGFVCPLMDGEQLSDYTISFERRNCPA
ncbi:MAG: hypothetical protein IPG89_15290 [Bacteroidetes bacterium]|nr:hypothetical protein [Bacteroidota bacterium]